MAVTATLKYSANSVLINSSPTNHVTTSFTTDDNSLLVVVIDCISDGSTQAQFSVSSSPSLTWTRQARASSNGSSVPPSSEIWTAPVTTGASTQVTISSAAAGVFSGDGVAGVVCIASVTGQDTVGNPIGLTPTENQNGSTTGALSVSMGGTTASTSLTIATVSCDGDYSAALVASGSGWTDLYKTQCGTNGWYRSTTEYIVGAISTYDFGALNDPYQHSSAAVEFKAASGGPATIPQTVNITATTTTALIKSAGKALGISSTTTTSIVKTINKALAITGTSTTSLLTTSFLALIAPLLGRPPIGPLSLNPAFRIRSTFNPASLQATGTVNPLLLTISCISTLSKLVSIGKPLSVTATSALSVIKAASKALSIASTSATAAVKSVGKQLAISSMTATTIQALKAFLKVVTITATSTTTVTKSVGKLLSIASTTAVAAPLKSVGKLISISSTTTTTGLALKAFLKFVSITCTTTASRGAFTVGKVASISATSTVSAARSVGKRLTIASTTSLSNVKSVGKTLAIACASTLTTIRSRATLVTLAITATTATTIRKAVTKPIAITATSALSVVRAISKRVSMACTSAVSAIVGRLYRITLSITATTATVVSGVRIFGANVSALARRIVGRATQAFIVGQPAIITIIGRATEPVTIVGTSLMTVHDIIDFICGDTWELTGPLQDANGAALDLTGATISWKLDTLDGATNKLSLSLGSGITVINSTTATILVKVSPTLTNTVTAGNYKDWLRVTLADGTVLTEWSGVIRVTGNPA